MSFVSIGWWVWIFIGLYLTWLLLGWLIGWEAAHGVVFLALVVITAYYAIQTGRMQDAMRRQMGLMERQVISDIGLRDISLLIEYQPKKEGETGRKNCKVKFNLDNKNMAHGSISQIYLTTRFEGEEAPREFLLSQVILPVTGSPNPDEPIDVGGNQTRLVMFNFAGSLDVEIWRKIEKEMPSLEWRLSYYDVVLGERCYVEINKEKVTYEFQ